MNFAFLPIPIKIKLLISYNFNYTIPTFPTMFHHTNMGVVLANGPTGSYWRISAFIHTMS